MRVLVVNAGSTSLKLTAVGPDDATERVDGLDAPFEVDAVGHRFVHGGPRFLEPILVDDGVERQLESLTDLAPLHNGPAVDALGTLRAERPELPQVAVFDTAFHATLPPEAFTYALPRRFRERGIRRYGFHGLAVQWAAERVPVSRLVVCHLGGGCSITAVRDGRSVDTTMGYTPLEGVPMATRSGSVDPGALIALLRDGVVTVDELDHALEHESGLQGLAGTSHVAELDHSDDADAHLALSVFAHRVAGAVAAMAASLDGLDALVFSGGIGENSVVVRDSVCRRLRFLGVEIDPDANESARPDCEITLTGSSVSVHVIRSREELVIARETRRLVEGT